MLKSMISRIVQRKTTGSNYRTSDLFLVEFPKSGVTWLSTLLANLILIKNEMPMKASFFNVSSQLILDTDMKGLSDRDACWAWPPYRVLKSHSNYNPSFVHVIYLVRHPYRVMDSYYRFLQGFGKVLPAFEQFVDDKQHGIPAWREHIRSWLVNESQEQRLHLIRYEDLRKDPTKEILELTHNLGWAVGEADLQEAIDFSSLASMSASEDLYRKRNPRHKVHMVNTGKIDIDDSTGVLGKIEKQCQEELRLLGYIV